MCLIIQKEGIFTSLQGLGNHGKQRFGVNPRGAMDRAAVCLINLLLGNNEDQKTLEFHFPAGELRFEETCRFALGGAEFNAEMDGRPIENWRVHEAAPSAVLRFKSKATGSRCYLAVAGGLTDDGPDVHAYRTVPLAKGTRLIRVREPNTLATVGTCLSPFLVPDYRSCPEIRGIPSVEYSYLSAESLHRFHNSDFKISGNSDRMGFRLNGQALTVAPRSGDLQAAASSSAEIVNDAPVDLVSAAVTFGTIQLLPDGQLIVLMADHQTTGGYPRLVSVISVDLPLLAQLGPGDQVRFRPTGIAEAEKLCRGFEQELRWLKTGVSFGRYW